ncbi:MAG: hypothetical protein RAP70_04310 [Candidatus Celaenobacter antarcticus]|nr:hypothetical protein [Candidatus Celaenobacter antarcticus]
MKNLWILQTNKQEFLDDCRDFQVYGVSDPKYKKLEHMVEGDILLLRLKHDGNKYAYLGPFIASTNKKTWVSSINEREGVWGNVVTLGDNSPRWISQFPWCIFLNPADNYINALRALNLSRSVPACEPINSPESDEIISNLIQDEYLPSSKANGYRTMRGVWVRSRGEHMIDNWFAEHGIVTYYEKAIYLDSIRIVPDWYIPSIKIYVEFLGLKGEPSYDNIWKRKEKTYNKHGVTYITLDEHDLIDLDRSIPMKVPELKLNGIQ